MPDVDLIRLERMPAKIGRRQNPLLTRLGVTELRTPEQVDDAVRSEGTVMIVVNSVCGCAAGKARPGIALALQGLMEDPEGLHSIQNICYEHGQQFSLENGQPYVDELLAIERTVGPILEVSEVKPHRRSGTSFDLRQYLGNKGRAFSTRVFQLLDIATGRALLVIKGIAH